MADNVTKEEIEELIAWMTPSRDELIDNAIEYAFSKYSIKHTKRANMRMVIMEVLLYLQDQMEKMDETL